MAFAEVSRPARKRAPSKRSIDTRERVLDAAEKVFADKGFDGATIRDIAAEAGEPVGTIHHHGEGKEALLYKTVARRARALSDVRLARLDALRAHQGLTLDGLLSAFLLPLFDLSRDEPRWHNYARLVAYVSADDRWRAISKECFDPTAEIFLNEIIDLVPGLNPEEAAEGFVFSVSAMLALLTAQKRIAALGGQAASMASQIDHLVRFCAAGFSSRKP